jgi:hypothetical protein
MRGDRDVFLQNLTLNTLPIRYLLPAGGKTVVVDKPPGATEDQKYLPSQVWASCGALIPAGGPENSLQPQDLPGSASCEMSLDPLSITMVGLVFMHHDAVQRDLR